MLHTMNSSQNSGDYSDDAQSPLEEGRIHGHAHSTKTGPSCGTRCVVCSDIAPPNTVFRRHYGVICCEACKCFFRRTVQMGRDYKCRFGNSCPVGRTAVNMKQVCQACRFQTCTRAGMKIESVKKFPRKSKDSEYNGSKTSNGGSNGPISSSAARTNNKDTPTKVLKREPGHATPISSQKRKLLNSAPSVPSNKSVDSKLSDGDFDYESEFEQFKFNISSPDLSLYNSMLDTSLPKLFSGESLENIHEKSSIPTPESIHLEERPSGGKGASPGGVVITKQPSPLVITRVSSGSKKAESLGVAITEIPTAILLDTGTMEGGVGVANIPKIQLVQSGEEKTGRELSTIMQENSKQAKKRGPNNEVVNWTDMLAKKIRLEEALNNINVRQAQVKANLMRLSSGFPSNGPHLATPTHMTPQQQDSMSGQSYSDTPHGTPAPSPIPSSPCLTSGILPTVLSHASYPNSPHPLNPSQPGTPINNNSLPTSPVYSNQPTPTSLYGATPSHMYFPSSSPQGTVFFNSPVTVPIYQPHPLVPALVHVPPGYAHSPNPNSSQLSSPQGPAYPSFKFPHHGNSPSKGDSSQLPSPSLTHDSEGKLSMEMPEGSEQDYRDIMPPRGSISAPPSACPSPINKPSRTLAADAPEAEVEEVLGSLKLRIRRMFKWARSEVEDFEDLSPLDQKALLRRTVSELVMLGFARASIAYEGMLLLGSTGKVIRSVNGNPGVATVAMVTLSKLVVPLKVLNIDDRELKLMEEIILFNPEANGLYNRETVRQYRKRKHIELSEYTEKHQPGRFGELMCLLTPLYEVSLEVTEQLRLEQFVHEGEARIDALLLMSMINHGGSTAEEPIEDVGGN